MNIQFWLVGKCDQSNPSSIPLQSIQQWEREGLIKYFGEIEDVRQILAQSTCIILPSYQEGVPRVLLEAMSMQKPIITTYVSGCKECIKDPQMRNQIFVGRNGIMVNARDPHALSKAIQYFLSLSRDEQEEMGKQGRNYAQERFEISKIIAIYQKKVRDFSKEGKRLVFISNTSFGMSNFRIEVLKALQAEGHEIHIIAPQDHATSKLTQEGLIFHPLTLNTKGLNPFEDFSTFLHLYKLLKHLSPSLVFNYTIKPVIYASLACNLLKIPNIAIITGLGYVFIPGGWKRQILKKFVSFLYKHALKKTQEVWFLNLDDQNTFLSHRIIDLKRTMLLDSEGINTAHFSPSPQHSKEIVFTLVARMLWDKGIGELIQSIRLLNSQ